MIHGNGIQMSGSEEKDILKRKLLKKIIQNTREYLAGCGREVDDDEVRNILEDMIFSDDECITLTFRESSEILKRAFYVLRKELDILSPLAEDSEVSEIMVNGANAVFVERNGQIEKTEITFDRTEDLEEIIRRIAAGVHREINELNPIVDARLADGSRVNAVYKNIALGGPILTIRKFPESAITMSDLIEYGSITSEAAEFLKLMVEARYNCFISGGTSSGKTTFLNVLSNYIPEKERVIVIEDSAELQIKHIENLVRMECRNANVQGKGEINMQQLIKTSLRMRPDRIIVGEVRGKEVVDMLQAMNTGHDGSMSSGHGNSIEGMLRRLEAMFLQVSDFPVDAIRSQIAEGIDIFIHLGRLSDGRRKVLTISEVAGMENGKIITRDIFRYSVENGLVRTGNELLNKVKLELKKGCSL